MAVQLWIGEKPESLNERTAIIALARGLDRLHGLYIMLVNFSVGGHTIDLVILKHDAIFVLEFKHCKGRVYGAVNGPWTVVSHSGSTTQLNPGRKNPYNQVVSSFYSFTNFLNAHKTELVPAQTAPNVDFRSARRVVVIVPTLELGSEIELDWKVQVKGLDELPTYLVMERSAGLDLPKRSLLHIPALLRCTPWLEINDLIAGEHPALERSASEPPETSATPLLPENVRPLPPTHKIRSRKQGWVVLALMALLGGMVVYVVAVHPPRPPGASLHDATAHVISTASLIPTIPEDGRAPVISNGITALHERVPRRWDAATSKWLWERAEDADVLVTLETVEFNNGMIRLAWTIENRLQQPISVPMTLSNIEITDGAVEYRIDQRQSTPAQCRVSPGTKETAIVVVTHPVQPSALILQVSLREHPFGKTTWLVPVPSSRQ